MVLALSVGACLGAAATADARHRPPAVPTIGIGDQKADMFRDQRRSWLGVRHARLVVPWYIALVEEERRYVDRWLTEARRAKVQPLVGFGHGFVGATRIQLPELWQYRAAFRAFRKRYPWVRHFIAWNEANHCSQPTCRRPERAAAYFDAMRSLCPRCTVVAADVIDQRNMIPWIKRFRRAARHKPRLWGLHNYLDVNRLRSTGTRRLLRYVPGTVWITESGGVVHRRHYRRKASFPENPRHAAKVTRYLLRLAHRHRRKIRRVYLYHWNADRARATWDSALINHRGQARAAFRELARYQRRDPRRAPAAPRPWPPFAPIPTEPPKPPPPTGGQEQPPPSGEPQPPPSGGEQPPQEPEPTCTLIVICP